LGEEKVRIEGENAKRQIGTGGEIDEDNIFRAKAGGDGQPRLVALEAPAGPALEVSAA